jgi:HK97 family phage portal protein
MYNRRRYLSEHRDHWSNAKMILDRLFSKRATRDNLSTLADPDDWLFQAFGAGPTASRISVTDRNATQITAFWSAVGTIADTLAELPLRLVQVKNNGTTKNIKSHPSLPLLTLSPNPMMTGIVAKSTIQAHSLTWGNGYFWVKRNRMREPLELWPLKPAETTAVIDKGKLYFDTMLSIGQTRLPARDVIHVPAMSRNGLVGMSIVAEQREMLGAIIATQQFGAKFFANGARAGGLIAYPGKVRDPEKIREAIEKAAGGENAHGLLVLSGDAKYQQFSIPPEDAQFLQTKEFGVDEVARMFRLPLHFLNKMGQATFNNLEQMGSHFAQYTMMPWVIRWEQELTRKMLTESEIKRGYRYKFNLGALMRGDIKTRSEVYAKGIQFGWVTRNEVRALEDMNPLEGLDDPLIPLNLGVVGEEAPEPEPPPEPAPEPDDDEVDETDDDEADRSFLILTAAVQRMANREAKAVGRILRSGATAADIADKLDTFYRGHALVMVENLAMSADDARQYCNRHGTEIFDAEETQAIEMLNNWTSTEVLSLVNTISEDL